MNKQALQKIARIFNENHISWGLGASSMLYFHGLVAQPRDIDLMVDEVDAEKAIALLAPFASEMQTDDGKGKYATRHFYEMVIDGQAVDVIGGYRILRGEWIYDFPTLKDLTLNTVELGGVEVPLTHLEDWYVAYLIMGDPKMRAPMIESYIENKSGFDNKVQILNAVEQIELKAPFETELLNALKKWI